MNYKLGERERERNLLTCIHSIYQSTLTNSFFDSIMRTMCLLEPHVFVYPKGIVRNRTADFYRIDKRENRERSVTIC